MGINVINNELTVCSAVCHLKNDFTTECDIIVPDTKPDIARILQVSARARITGSETQNDRVIISGTVNFNILYLADNEEKSVKSIDSSCVFSNLFQHNGIRENMLSVTNVDVSELNFNIANCRKLTLKAILSGEAEVFSCGDVSIISDIENAKTKKTALFSTVIAAHAESEATVVENIEIPQGKKDIEEVLKSDARITGSDIKIIDDKVIIKGSVLVTTLYSGEGKIEYVESELLYAHVLDAEGIRQDMLTDYDAKITGLNVNAAPDINGKLRCLDISADLFFRIIARRTQQTECVTDAYLPHGAVELKKNSVSVSGIENSINNEVNFKETISLPDNIAPIDTVYETIARPIIQRCEIEGDKLKISGYTEIYILYLSSDETFPVFSHKANVDFSVVTDAPDCSLVPLAKCNVRGINYVLGGERSIEVRGSISITTRCIREKETEFICDAEEKEYIPEKRPSIIVSFVSGESSLWDIAKEYNIDEKELLSANALASEEEVQVGMALIIPK